jgi:hypothetical protein|tara:strand:- start:49269 stop:49508 length:240 start_codon:yes stop_codon:yes gene_type:complete
LIKKEIVLSDTGLMEVFEKIEFGVRNSDCIGLTKKIALSSDQVIDNPYSGLDLRRGGRDPEQLSPGFPPLFFIHRRFRV